jgi:hypothetical protein
MRYGSLKIPIVTSQDLSAGDLDFTTSVGRRFKLESISIHFSVAVTETITITRDSAKGANYDTVLASQDLVNNQSYVFRPQGEENEYSGDEIRIQCTNANATGICYMELKLSEHLQ